MLATTELTIETAQLLEQLTRRSDVNQAVRLLAKRVIDLEIIHWKQKEQLFQDKWKMTFEQFTDLYETSTDIEKLNEYHDWQHAYCSVLFFEKMKKL